MNYWNKILIKKLIHLTPSFYKYKKKIFKTEKPQIVDIINILRKVPYYNGKKEYIHSKSLTDFPFLDKNDIIGNEELFISKDKDKKYLVKISTGGTTGKSLNFYKTVNDIIKEEAYLDYVFSYIGKDLKIGVLRGNRPKKGLYEYKYNTLLLSSYDLSLDNVRKYLFLINKYKINCLHVYPTSIQILIKYINLLKNEIEIPKIKGVISSSEIMSVELKQQILNTFKGVTLIDLYGQNEHVAFAFSINMGYYTFLDSYSHVEYIETNQFINNNRICEIIGTNTNNLAMPLIRYRTDDFVELDKENNIVSILGRSSDFIVNMKNEVIPCIVVTRDKTLENVITFQYYQEKVGELTFYIVVNEKFSLTDEKNILDDFNNCFNGLMHVRIVCVESIDKTSNGKQKRLIQMLKF